MCPGDRGADSQSHADALRVCRVERLKNSAQMFGVHARPHLNPELPECCSSVSNTQDPLPIADSAHSFHGVHDEIQYYLFEQDTINTAISFGHVYLES